MKNLVATDFNEIKEMYTQTYCLVIVFVAQIKCTDSKI